MSEDNEVIDIVRYALEQYGNDIYRLAFTYMKNKEDSEDIVQDTLIKLMKNNTKFDSEEHLKAWLLRVAINLCKDKLKSANRKNIPIDENIVEKNIYSMEEKSDVLEAVLTLPEQYRSTIHLYYYEQYSTKEIAIILGKNESTVRSLLKRGRTKLQKILKCY